MVNPTILLAAIVGLLLAPAFRPLNLHTIPVGGSSEPAIYDIFPTMNHFGLMPGSEVAGMAPELDAGASTSFHPRGGDPSYPATLSEHTFDEYFGITQ